MSSMTMMSSISRPHQRATLRRADAKLAMAPPRAILPSSRAAVAPFRRATMLPRKTQRASVGVVRSALENLRSGFSSATSGPPPDASTFPLGANLDGRGGCVFRVWAPFPKEAYLVTYGEGAQAQETRLPMTRDGDIWTCTAAGISAGQRYHLAFKLPNGEEIIRRDPHARQTEYDGDTCLVVDPSAFQWTPFTSPPADEIVMYQLQVGSFSDTGDFKGLEAKLDHIAGMGFTALQLLPVNEFCGSWGYNPRMLFNIMQSYGTPQQLRELVDAAHKKGLAVIFDTAIHHGSARMNSLWEYDGWAENNNGGIYHEKGADTPYGRQFAFWKEEVWSMLEQSTQMWFEEYNADGLRLDSIHNVPWKKLQHLTYELQHRFPGKYIIAEITPETPDVIRDGGCNSEWIHMSFYDVRKFEGGYRSMNLLKSLVSIHQGFERPSECIKYFLGSHDQVGCRKNGGYDPSIEGTHRYAAGYYGGRGEWDARAKVRMWYSLNAFCAGAPMIFMGAEHCRDDWWHTDEHRMQWGLHDDEISTQTIATFTAANTLRKENMAMRGGGVKFVHEDSDNGILGFLREYDDDKFLVLINTGGQNFMASESNAYGVSAGGLGGSFTQIYNSQAAEFGGWEQSWNREAVPVSDGRVTVSIPKLSVQVWKLGA